MEWLGTILSSAVIAATISFFAGEKENRLKYITAERAEWRKEIKNIAGGLSECPEYGKKAKRLLTNLKFRINSYGRKKEYSSDILLQVFSDEHIWKEISAIERGENFIEHRDRLLVYLELSLKFDWEKSKSEAKTEQKPIVLTIMYILMVFVSIYINYVNINGKEITSNLFLIIQEGSYSILWQITPLLLFCTPLFIKYVGVLEEKESYKRNALDFLCFLVGEVLLLVFWLMLIMLTGKFIYYIFWFMEMFMGFLFFAQIVNQKKIYREYSNNVMTCFVDEPVLIYSANSVLQELISMLKIEPEFNNRGITYKKINDLSVLTDDDAQSLINGWKHKKTYEKLIKKDTTLTKKEFLLQHPEACKIFIKWDNDIIVGRAPKEWKNMATKISKDKRNVKF